MKIPCKIIQKLKRQISDDIYVFYLNRLDKKYHRTHIKWNNISRQCYELQQHTNPIFIRNCSCPAYVRQYIKACERADKLSNELKNLETKRENFRKKHSTTNVK